MNSEIENAGAAPAETTDARRLASIREHIQGVRRIGNLPTLTTVNIDWLLSMAARTLDAEQRAKETQQYLDMHTPVLNLIDRQGVPMDTPDYDRPPTRLERLDWLLKDRRQARAQRTGLSIKLADAQKQAQEATARAERAKGDIQNASMIGRRIQAHSTASEKVKELAQHLRRICEEAYPPSKPSILRDTVLPPRPLCTCLVTLNDDLQHDPACPVHGEESK